MRARKLQWSGPTVHSSTVIAVQWLLFLVKLLKITYYKLYIIHSILLRVRLYTWIWSYPIFQLVSTWIQAEFDQGGFERRTFAENGMLVKDDRQKLREPLSILIKYKTIDTPKIDNILKIYFDVSTKL